MSSTKGWIGGWIQGLSWGMGRGYSKFNSRARAAAWVRLLTSSLP